MVRKKNLVGLGKETNRVEAGRVLGQSAVSGRAKQYIDPDPFNRSASEVARRLGVSRRTECQLRRKGPPLGSGTVKST